MNKLKEIIKKEKFQIIIRVIFILLLLLFISGMFFVNVKKFESVEEVDIDQNLVNMKMESEEETKITGTPELIEYFDDNGIALSYNGVSQSSYDIEKAGLSFKVDENVLDVYEYDGSKKAKEEATLISKRFNSSKIVGEVHFYRSDNIIVAYEGSSSTIISLLQNAFGPQFAGE